MFNPTPSKINRESGIDNGMQVLEAGCGNGAFTNYNVRAVGNKGKIFALIFSKRC